MMRDNISMSDIRDYNNENQSNIENSERNSFKKYQ